MARVFFLDFLMKCQLQPYLKQDILKIVTHVLDHYWYSLNMGCSLRSPQTSACQNDIGQWSVMSVMLHLSIETALITKCFQMQYKVAVMIHKVLQLWALGITFSHRFF